MEALSEHKKNRGAFLFFLSSLSVLGIDVELETNDDARFVGNFYTATPFPKEAQLSRGVPEVALKTAKAVENGNSSSTSIFKASDVVSISMSDYDFQARSQDLMTDATVRKKSISHLDGRELQGVDNTWLSDNTAANLTSAGIGNWNQFDANRDKFGVNSSYDENLYTKKLDKSSITKSQIQKAEKLARAIESSTSKNIHMQEERGQISLNESLDWDEEDRFSGVGIIGKVPNERTENSSIKLQKSLAENNTTIDSSKLNSRPEAVAANEHDQQQSSITTGEKKKEYKLNANAAEWKPPFGQSNASESPVLPSLEPSPHMIMFPEQISHYMMQTSDHQFHMHNQYYSIQPGAPGNFYTYPDNNKPVPGRGKGNSNRR